MATMAPAPTSTENITPPRSSHGYTDSWGYSVPQKEVRTGRRPGCCLTPIGSCRGKVADDLLGLR
jgi:hypothetical protein